MPPEPPRRPGNPPPLPIARDEVAPGAVRPFREAPWHEDGPPNVRPRVQTQTGMPAPPRESRPQFSRPPPPELEEGERPSMVEFQREVKARLGRAQFSGPAWVFVLVLIVGLLVANVYFSAKRGDVPQNAATKDDVTRVEAKCDALRNDLGNLAATMNQNADRQHNEWELFKLKFQVDATQQQRAR